MKDNITLSLGDRLQNTQIQMINKQFTFMAYVYSIGS